MDSSKTKTEAASLPVNLGWALASLLRTYQKQVEAVLSDLPGGSRAFLVMTLVERETCHSQIAIADRLSLDKTTLTYLLDGLEKDELIRRTTDPNDRRSRHINLTDKGAVRLGELAKAVGRVELDVLAPLTHADAAQFYRSLLSVAGLAGTLQADAENGSHSAEICQAALTGS